MNSKQRKPAGGMCRMKTVMKYGCSVLLIVWAASLLVQISYLLNNKTVSLKDEVLRAMSMNMEEQAGLTNIESLYAAEKRAMSSNWYPQATMSDEEKAILEKLRSQDLAERTAMEKEEEEEEDLEEDLKGPGGAKVDGHLVAPGWDMEKIALHKAKQSSVDQNSNPAPLSSSTPITSSSVPSSLPTSESHLQENGSIVNDAPGGGGSPDTLAPPLPPPQNVSASEGTDLLISKHSLNIPVDDSLPHINHSTQWDSLAGSLLTTTLASLVSFVDPDDPSDKNLTQPYQAMLLRRFNNEVALEERTQLLERPSLWLMNQAGILPTGSTLGMFQRLFNELGYYTIESKSLDVPADAAVIWSHEVPYRLLPYEKLHRSIPAGSFKVNHFPSGLSYIAYKAKLLSTLKAEFMPQSFCLSSELDAFRDYLVQNPNKRFLIKKDTHRGVALLTPENITDIMRAEGEMKQRLTSRMFAQEFIPNPFLIDGRKFDLRIYVAVTNVDPVRAYIYGGFFPIRFCDEPDQEDLGFRDRDAYVCNTVRKAAFTDIHSDSLRHLFDDLKASRTFIVLNHLENAGISASRLLDQVDHIVKTSVIHAAKYELPLLQRHRHEDGEKNLMQLLRFDTLMDVFGNLHLLEVNIPDMGADVHFDAEGNMQPDRMIRIAQSFLRLTGASTIFSKEGTALKPEFQETVLEDLVPEKELYINIETCSSELCANCSTDILECRLCSRCMSDATKRILRNAFWEHVNQGLWRRVIPRSFDRRLAAQFWYPGGEEVWQKDFQLSDQLLALWYRGKCVMDVSWCR